MVLRLRPATLEELIADRPLLDVHYASSLDALERLPEAWASMLAHPAVMLGVVEDMSDPRSPRVVAHAARAFIKPDFCHDLRTCLGPCVGGQIVEAMLRGESPLPTPEEIHAAHHGEGICMAILHTAYHGTPVGEIGPHEIQEAMNASFYAGHRGYRFKEFLHQSLSADEVAWYDSAGGRLRRDYREVFKDEAESPRPNRPFLLGVTREEALANRGARIAALFIDYPVKLGLQLPHKELLMRALMGETDEEMATSLGVSMPTLKRRWRGVYEHLESHAPAFLELWGGANLSGTRGGERRRHLLNYLREHPEELQPFI